MMNSAFPLLSTEKLLLGKFTDQDLSYLFKGLSDPEVVRHYGINFRTLEATKEQLDWFARNEREGTGIWWVIADRNGSGFLGAIGLNSIKMQHRKAEIGFWLLKENWGKGIMKEAITEVLRYAFEILGLHRIEAVVETENERCNQLLYSLGFSLEGTMRDCELKNGWFISLNIFAILAQNPLN